MKRSIVIVIVIAGALFEACAWAQVPPALRAADPSQQLKSAGFTTSAAAQGAPDLVLPAKPREPLITGVDEAANGRTPGNHAMDTPAPIGKPATRDGESEARMRRIRALIDQLGRSGKR